MGLWLPKRGTWEGGVRLAGPVSMVSSDDVQERGFDVIVLEQKEQPSCPTNHY